MSSQLAIQINQITDLSLMEIESVDGGWATFGRALAGSFVGRAIYDAVVYVAKNGGPPPPNLGFH